MAASVLPLVLGSAAVLAVLAVASGAQKAELPPEKELVLVKQLPDPPPADVIERITRALATGDPKAMRFEADGLEKVGWIAQGVGLRRAADLAALARAIGDQPPANTVIAGDELDPSVPWDVPNDPIADSPLPGRIKAGLSPTTATAEQLEAQELVELLITKPPKPGELSRLVVSFQQHNELKPSGYYNPSTAIKLVTSYGLVPPKPINWPTKGRTKARKNYRDAMFVFAAKDSQRAEEFIRAGKV